MNLEWLDGIAASAVTWGMTALGGIALIIAGLILARVVRGTMTHALRRVGLQSELIDILSTLAYYLTVAVVLIAAFGVMGIETASLITILGTCTLAIGLALQGSLSNFASGVMLFVFRPFSQGDLIETGEFLGRVANVGVFSTKIDTLQNVYVEIPNSYISQRPLRNWSRNGSVRLDLVMEVDIESHLPTIKTAIAAALAAEPRVLDEPAPFIGVDDFGDTSAICVIRPWCASEDYWTLRYELPEAIRQAVEAAGGRMPTPRREIVHVGAAPAAATGGA